MPSPYYYVKQPFFPRFALPDIVRFLINDHPTITGPGWTIIEAQSGANREIPSDASDLDSLVSATAWPNGELAAGDWIVLESMDSNNTNHFQLYMEYEGVAQILFLLMPFQDFPTGGGAASPPTFPSTGFGTTAIDPTSFIFSTFNHLSFWTLIADEGMFLLHNDGGHAGQKFSYFGEVDPSYGGRDPRCYVMRDGETTIEHANSGYIRLSPMDNITKIALVTANFETEDTTTPIHDLTTSRIFDVGFFTPTGISTTAVATDHLHFTGWLRYVYSTRWRSNNQVTITPDRKWLIVVAGISDPSIMLRWNGAAY